MDGSPLTRRRFVAGAGTAAAAAAILGPRSALARPGSRPTLSGRFAEGLMSGDPTPSGITLWTRLAGAGGKGTVELEISPDRSFRRCLDRRLITTSGGSGHAVKTRIDGLKPYEQYYYRFATRSADSPIGRFRTALPADSRQPVSFAYFTCQEFGFGYYNAHELLAREDVDFVIDLADYIYSDVQFNPPIGVRRASFPGDFTLDDYRAHYTTYRTDPALRRVHSAFPLISLWDDHEVQNDYAGGDPRGGDAAPSYTKARRQAAYRAFFESMPTFAIGRQRLFHRASFGSTVDLFVLDERQYRAAQPSCPTTTCPELDDPRAMLGRSQLDFARSGIKRSRAAWKVIANEVTIMPMRKRPGELGDLDAWDGYPVEREALLRTVRDVEDVVFVTGDYHAFISGDVRTRNGTTVAAEFVAGSVTSATDTELLAIGGTPGYGTPDAPRVPARVYADQRAANPGIYDDLDYLHHGYVTCRASASSFKATFKKLETIRRRSTSLAETRSWTLRRGRPGLVR